MAQVPAQQEDDMSDSAEDMNRRKECPKLKEIESASTCKGRLIKVSNVRGAKMGSWGEDLQRG